MINLPEVAHLPAEEASLIRVHPSRFKTLALLGEFADDRLLCDFHELETYVTEDGVQGVVPKRLLATMVYVDCLDHLENMGLLFEDSREKRYWALEYIEHSVQQWYEHPRRNTDSPELSSPGDLSYAIDLLLRTDRLSPNDPLMLKVERELVSAIEQSEDSRSIPTAALYCAIQLASHFRDSSEEDVRRFVRHLGTKYETLGFKNEPAFFHPLVLRALLAYHGERLRGEMIGLLLERQQRDLALRFKIGTQERNDHLRSVIAERFDVQIREVEELTGGITEAEVFRVHFDLEFRSISETGAPRIHHYPVQESLVIKRGTPEALRRCIARYRNLPEPVKPYFANYMGDPHVIADEAPARAYLVMEDLSSMDTLRDLLTELDQPALFGVKHERLRQMCSTVADSLLDIYASTQHTGFPGFQLARLYTGGLEASLIRMAQSSKFPHLKPWFRGFHLGDRKFASVSDNLKQGQSAEF